MIDRASLAATVAATVELLERSGARFHRGDPQRYLLRVAGMIDGLTLPFVPTHARAAALRAKCSFSAWGLVMDDEIDREGTRGVLDESLLWQANARAGRATSEPSSVAARLLDEFWAQLPVANEEALDGIRFGIDEMLLGFSHEHTSNRRRRMANSLEYRKYGVAALGFKPLFDIDFAFVDVPPEPSVYTTLRMVYDHLALALKYASDIGSLERELAVEDNLNIVRIRAAETGRLPLDHARPRGDALRVQLDALASTVAEIRLEVEASRAAARALLDRIPQVPMHAVLDTIDALIEHYCSGRDVV